MTEPKPIPFKPITEADYLALEISRKFNDEVRLPLYRQICAAHNRTIVYKAFRETMAIPAEQIKKSRRALFLFILHAYDRPDSTRD